MSDAWITVAEAAVVAHRTPATIYSWIRQGRLYSTTDGRGRTLVKGRAVLECEAKVKIGRPIGSASSSWW